MKRNRISIFVFLIFLLSVNVLSGCKEQSVIGNVDNMASVAALVFETADIGDGTGEGVFYRQINNIDKLLASQEALLIAFLDHNPPSDNAIPFLETMCDDFSGRLQVVRVNVEISENNDDVDYLKSLFEVKGYPLLVLVSKGNKVYEFIGYDDEIKENIIAAVRDFVSR